MPTFGAARTYLDLFTPETEVTGEIETYSAGMRYLPSNRTGAVMPEP